MPRGGSRPGAGRKRDPNKPQKTRAPKRAVVATSPAQVVVPPVANPHSLSPKELLFVESYTGISKFNASDAYVRAGFKPSRHNAARLITRDNVATAIAERLGSRLRTLQMDGDEALEGISRIARADVRKVLTEAGDVRPIHELDDDTADAIQSIKVVERRVPDGVDEHGKIKYEVEYTKEFKFYDKLDARKTMAKAAGKLIERHGVVDGKGKPMTPRRVIIELADARS